MYPRKNQIQSQTPCAKKGKKAIYFPHPTLHGHLFGTRFNRVLRGPSKRHVLDRNIVVVVATAAVAATA
jgi:hypothetical protein